MAVFDVTTPVGSENISSGDDRIRELKTAIQDAFRGGAAEGTEAVFPGAAPTSAPIFRYRGLKGTTAQRPASGQYGLYFNTDLNALQRDNGATWDTIGESNPFPAGTVMPFYQASPPTGWTAVAVNDKFMRVVTSGGSGGTSGGSGSTPASGASMAHTHTLADDGPTIPSQIISTEAFPVRWVSGSAVTNPSSILWIGGGAGPHDVRRLQYTTVSAGSTLAFTYADFCVGSKD